MVATSSFLGSGFPITVQNLRTDIFHRTLGVEIDQPTMVLRTVGRPLWDYTSDRVLTGFCDALESVC